MGRRKTIEANKPSDVAVMRISKSKLEIFKQLGGLRGTSAAEAIEYVADKFAKPEVVRLLKQQLKQADK